MIVYSLRCQAGHEFDGWFRDSAAFDSQQAAGEISCPMCGTAHVAKALMAPAVRSSEKRAATKEADSREVQAQVLQALKEVRRTVEENCDYVGTQFAEEARRIHYGEADERGIYGEATDDEAAELAEEGIDIGRIPWIRSDT
jgi:hypothetical protein